MDDHEMRLPTRTTPQEDVDDLIFRTDPEWYISDR